MVSSTVSTILAFAAVTAPLASTQCDTVEHGYQCNTSISHNWGQYSPYFTVPTEIGNGLPSGCEYTFVNVLSRHGARNPTSSKTTSYAALIAKIHNSTKSYGLDYEFIKNYTYTLGANNLTPFGEQEMINSGEKFYNRYDSLVRTQAPFVRSSSDQRVVESAQNFTQGFGAACDADNKCQIASDYASYADNIVILSEATGSNDTLDPSTCNNFQNGYYSTTNNLADADWEAVFIPPIQARVNKNLVGANLTITDIVYLMDLCPFNTVQTLAGSPLSPFCSLFTEQEWKYYNYLRSVDKWYADGPGNHLGSSQGVGFANELIARMTNSRTPVMRDAISVNHTLDISNTTFPLGLSVYADFSHDDPMESIFSALGLLNGTSSQLSNTTFETLAETNQYSAGHTVPFAARAYFEKMTCKANATEELVRIVVNDRVATLPNCGADAHGRCTLTNWVNSLTFVAQNGLWSQC